MDLTVGNNSHHAMNIGQPLSAVQVITTVGAALLSLTIVSGNLLVIAAFVRDKSLRNITNNYLVSLAFADLLVGAIVIPIFTLKNYGRDNEQRSGDDATLCYFFQIVDIFSSSSSIFHLCVIAGDRYMAIVHSMTYPAKMTRKVSLVLIGTAWCLSLGVSGLWVGSEVGFGQNNTNTCTGSFSPLFSIISSCVSFFLPAVLMMIFYTKTFLTARAHIRRIQRGRMAISGNGGGQDAMRIHRGGNTAIPGASRGATAMHSEYKVAKTLGLVIAAFLLCWLPFFVLNIILPLFNEENNSLRSIRYLSYWLGYINSAINPFIYAFTNSSFRKAFSKIICCRRNTRRDQWTANSRASGGRQTNLQNTIICPVSFPVEFPLPFRYF
ncbi:octopamine receptor beta-2R-like [Asterias amurensis]|uniref:octopamine receptor beta-2R-like n=1 Tax=Asterias amurensis TaxID=7602 RepID=UPI003AB21182